MNHFLFNVPSCQPNLTELQICMCSRKEFQRLLKYNNLSEEEKSKFRKLRINYRLKVNNFLFYVCYNLCLKLLKNRNNTTIIFVTDENEAKANATSQVSTRRKTQRIET